jgi:hypothetical protein
MPGRWCFPFCRVLSACSLYALRMFSVCTPYAFRVYSASSSCSLRVLSACLPRSGLVKDAPYIACSSLADRAMNPCKLLVFNCFSI